MLRYSLFTLLLLAFVSFCGSVFAQDSELKSAIDLAQKYSHEGQVLKSDSMLAIASSKINDDSDKEDVFRFKYYLAQCQTAKWNLKEADSLFVDATNYALALNDTIKMVVAMSGMATVKNLQGNVLEAISIQEEAKEMSLRKDSVKYFGLVANLGIAYNNIEQYDKALTYYLSAKQFYQTEGELTNQALVENNLGELYRERFNDYELAEQHYRAAIGLNKSVKNYSNLSLNYHNFALNFLNKQETDSALKYISLAIDLKKQAGEEGRLATDYHVLGDIYFQAEEYDLAKEKYEKTRDLSKKYSIPPGIYYANLGLANVYEADGNQDRAQRYAIRALDAAKEMNSPSMNMAVYKWLYDFNRKQRNFADAIFFLEKHNALSDSLDAERDEQVLNAKRAQYETDLAKAENEKLILEKKANEASSEYQRLLNIGLIMSLIFLVALSSLIYVAYRTKTQALKRLSALNNDLKVSHEKVVEQKEELRKLNKLKTNIVSVLGHDLRGPLTSVVGLIQLLRDKTINEDEFGEMTRLLNEKTNTGLKSLDMILEWSRLKAGDSNPKITQIDPKPQIDEIIDLNREAIADKSLNVVTDFAKHIAVPADPNQFLSIANNLISNAIKYSENGGELKIGTKETAEQILFFVKDSGAGFSEDMLDLMEKGERLISSKGSRGEKGTGIGLRIVRDFVEAHKGDFRIENHANGGGLVSVSFPKVNRFAKAV